MKKHLPKTLLSFIISGIFLYLAFRNIELPVLWLSLKQASWLLILISAANALFSIWLRAVRWRILLAPLKRIALKSVFSCTMIGFMANNLLPAHAGEVIKPYVLGKKENISGMAALATVLIERLLDSVSLITLLLLVLEMVPVEPVYQHTGMIIGVGSLGLIALLISLASSEGKTRSWLFRFVEWLPQKVQILVRVRLETFLKGLTVFNDWHKLLPLIAISLFTWAHMAATIYIILQWYPYTAVPPESNLAVASVVVLVFMAFAIALPAAPGYFGTTQVVFIFALSYFGINEVDAVGASLIYNFTQYIPITFGGIVYLFKEGYTFGQIRSASQGAKGVERSA